MAIPDSCPSCGAALPPGSGITRVCPACAFALVLEPGADDTTVKSKSDPHVGSRFIGPYRLLQKVGEGGMGEVWQAEQIEPIRRTVALKLIKPGMDTRQVIARFEAERQALALMDHPCVAKVFDAGSTPEGRPYFAMEYVSGLSITEHCNRHSLTTEERLALFLQVCAGVQHAHQKGVIHRDLKPSNVLVSLQGGVALPKIIDFGVAKATAQRLTEKTLFTEIGVLIGTPEYMSPEQADPTIEDVDGRTDVYALGVILYELLVGALPFEPRALREAGFEGIRRMIREVEPEKPSVRLSTLPGERSTKTAKERRVDPSTLRRQLTGELDWIIMKALEKDRSRRYRSPGELAADLERRQRNEPIVAGPPSATYRLRKLLRRHRSPLRWVAGSAAITALAAFAIVAKLPSRAPVAGKDPPRPFVAIRKFRNLAAQDQDYFAAGMTLEIKGQLSKIAALRLLSRTYDEHDTPSRAAELGVEDIVNGAVRRDGDRLTVSVELIDARKDRTLWSQQYERPIADIFAVENDAALQIARTLAANVTQDERARIQKRPTENMDAHDLYLRFFSTAHGESLLKQAIALDPNYALAKAQLAYSESFGFYNGDAQASDRAIALAREAAAIDPTLSLPHSVLGSAYSNKGNDTQARLAYLRSLELDPNSYQSMVNLSLNEATYGRLDESLLWARRGFALTDSRSVTAFYHVGIPLRMLRAHAETLRFLSYGERQLPDDHRIQDLLAEEELQIGDDERALARLRRAAERWPDDDEIAEALAMTAFLAHADDADALAEKQAKSDPDGVDSVTPRVRWAYFLKRRGDRRAVTEAAEALERGRKELAAGNQDPWVSTNMAAAFMIKDDPEAALASLTRGVENGFREYDQLERMPIFQPITGDPRFRALVRKMTEDLTQQRKRAAERGLLDLQTLIPELK